MELFVMHHHYVNELCLNPLKGGSQVAASANEKKTSAEIICVVEYTCEKARLRHS